MPPQLLLFTVKNTTIPSDIFWNKNKCNSLIFNSLSTGFAAAGSLFASCAAYKLAQSVGDVTAVYASSTIFVVILAWAFLGVNVFLLKKATNCHTEDHKFLAL